MPQPDTQFAKYQLNLALLQFTSGIKIHDLEIEKTT